MIAGAALIFGPAAPQASALDLGKPFKKFGHWVTNQTLGDTGKNANAAAGAARAAAEKGGVAADKAALAAEQTQRTLESLTLPAQAALWSIFGVMVILGLSLLPKTFGVWIGTSRKTHANPSKSAFGAAPRTAM